MAAGLGFKTFTTGEVLTAADTNGYLMQGVLVFASSAARAAAITSPQEGQYSYLKDTNSTEYYDGAAWIAAPIGDITGVTAGVGISGGGTSGDVTVTNSMATAITTAGDLIKGTGSGTFNRLGIGSTGQVLTVASGAPAWATPASGGAFTLLSTTTLSSRNQVISSIDQTYKHLFVLVTGITNSGAGGMRIDCNSNASSCWATRTNQAATTFSGSAIYSGQFEPQLNVIKETDPKNALAMWFYDYASATVHPFTATFSYVGSASGNVETTNSAGGIQFATLAGISSIRFDNYGGAFTAGTVKIYGVN